MPSSSTDPIILVLSYALAAVIWAWMWLHIISKIGHRGLTRKIWLVVMGLHPTLPIAMISLLILPWRIHQELKRLKKPPTN